MEIIIIILLIVMIILLGYLVMNFAQSKKPDETIQLIEEAKQKQLEDMNINVSTLHNKMIEGQKENEFMQRQLDNIIKTMHDSDMQSASAGKDLESIKDQIAGINNIMINTKHRGTFGEYQLNNLLSVYCGDSNGMWEAQYQLKNGFIADVALHLPGEKTKFLAIDSKFPLEAYLKLTNSETPEDYAKYESQFKSNVKKHINDIARKYINSETVEQAIMFIPSEAVYYHVCSKCPEIIEEGYKKHVLITSPTTLIGVTFTLVNINREFKRNQNIKKIEKTIASMKADSSRMVQRFDKAKKSLQSSLTAIDELEKSCNKINNNIETVYQGYDEEGGVDNE